jgi:hypothetical protein
MICLDVEKAVETIPCVRPDPVSAREGVKRQMSVPTNVLSNFMACRRAIPELGTWMENGVNVDPKPLSVEEFATAGVPVS